MRSKTKGRTRAALAVATVAALVGLACDQPVSPDASRLPAELGGPQFHPGGEEQQCPVKKFTGGGRIDPVPPNSLNGKVTFGFNIHVNDNCEPIKGQLQVVHHPTQSKYHAGTTASGGSITSFSEDDACAREGFEGGARWSGTVRAKHGNGSWHEHSFIVRVCDNGEPGRGRDTFRFVVSEHGDTGDATGDTPLTGGNIQAHGKGGNGVPF